MLDFVSIFSRTGLVIWQKSFCKLLGSPIDELITTVLMEEKAGEMSSEVGPYALKWSFSNVNTLEFVFVV